MTLTVSGWVLDLCYEIAKTPYELWPAILWNTWSLEYMISAIAPLKKIA